MAAAAWASSTSVAAAVSASRDDPTMSFIRCKPNYRDPMHKTYSMFCLTGFQRIETNLLLVDENLRRGWLQHNLWIDTVIQQLSIIPGHWVVLELCL